MRKLLPSLLLLIASLFHCPAQSAFQPDRQYTNELNNARARLQSQQPKLATNELNLLAATLARSNRLGQIIPELLFSATPDFTNAAALLKEFPGKIDDLQRHGQPLLYAAVNENKPDLLDFLLEQKANPNAATSFGEPVLMQAMQYGRWDMAPKLILAGASVTRTNSSGQSPASRFFESWYPGNTGNTPPTNLVPLMIAHGLDPFAASRRDNPASILEECLNRESGYRNSPTPGLSFYSDLLLTNNASPARRTPLGDTALHLAAYYQNTNAIEFLLQAGFNIDQTNNAGLTPLQSLVGMGQAGAQLPYYFNQRRSIPAGAPTTPQPSRPLTMSEYLLSRDATLDVFSAAGLGLTNELAALLRTNAALANARDGYGRTPLHYAVLNGGSFVGGAYYGGFRGPMIWSGPMSQQIFSGRGYISGPARVIGGGAPVPTNGPSPAVVMLLDSGADPSAATTRLVPQQHNAAPLPAGTTPLQLAARNGNTPVMRALLTARANVKLADADGNTALHLAARTWQTNAIPLLLTARASLEVTNLASQTPLRVAVESGVSTAVAVLLDAGASPTNGLGNTTLMHFAAERGDVATLTVLLKHKLPLEARDAEGRTPFQKAIVAKNWSSLTFLRDQGANLFATNFAGDTALHLLAAQQDDTVYHQPEESTLVSWERRQLSTPGWTGRSLNWLIQSKVLNPPPAMGWTNTSLGAWLIERGAKVNATNRAGRTPLHALCSSEWARWARWYQTAQSSNRVMVLLNAGANLDLADTNGSTPLHLAATNESPQMFKFLLAKAGPAMLNRPDAEGRTLLHRAVESSRDNFEHVTALLAAGANVNAADKEGSTPLHAIMQLPHDGWMYRRRELTFILLTNKANPNLTDKQGRTPLAVALSRLSNHNEWNQREVIITLLTNGASPNIPDRDGNTAVHRFFLLAATNNSGMNMSDTLPAALKARADWTLTNHAGRTPLHLFAELNRPFWHTLHMVGDYATLTNAAFAIRDPNGNTPLHLWATHAPDCSQCGDVFGKLLSVGDRASLTNRAGDTPVSLLLSATNRNWMTARVILNSDFATNSLATPDRNGQPLLHRLVASLPMGYYDTQQWLRRALTNKSLVNLTNLGGDTPLHIALRRRDSWLPRILMEAGADPMLKNAAGETPLRLAAIHTPNGPAQVLPPGAHMPYFFALRSRNDGEVDRWLEADPGLATITNRDGITPLMAASEARKTGLADRLLKMGATMDALSALRLGRTEEFRALLANVPRPVPPTWTFEAVRFGQLDGLQQLIAASCDLQFADADGHSLLFRARTAEQTGIADWLAAQNCRETFFDLVATGDRAQAESRLDADKSLVAQTNRNGRVPLIPAVASGKTEIVALLLERGAPADALAADGWSTLHLAAANDSVDVARLLLKASVATNALTTSRLSPLDVAAIYGATNVAELLVQHGAPVNAQPEGGFKNSPLHWAVHMGQLEMVKLLLAHGADMNLKNNRNGGETPLALARVSGNSTGMGFGYPPEITKGHPGHNRPAEDRAAIVKLLEEAAVVARASRP